MDTRVSAWYARLGAMEDVRYMHRSTRHWRPLLNGYRGHDPRSYIDLLTRMDAFPGPAALDYLQGAEPLVIIVHEARATSPPSDGVVERLLADPRVGLLARDEDAGARLAFLTLAPQVRTRPPIVATPRP